VLLCAGSISRSINSLNPQRYMYYQSMFNPLQYLGQHWAAAQGSGCAVDGSRSAL
jgi:hypothetical protein